ncbi:hypothetical protein [Bradyrhizobium aeschynomenes]|uniref:hypothetical protein n=1 Tax=Bradyrhizobium aeschynomenes TaxID=2734909 RepID=UPI001555B544|nr:hypothetical protein [Bradyrhizobium aeschynomenes]NPV22230.1 hypothetical protein [Bradyrhizobium aeschynomenes]
MTYSDHRAFTRSLWRGLAPLLLALAFTSSEAPAQSPSSTSAAKAAPKIGGAGPKAGAGAAGRESGPCETGVIAALGDVFTVQKNGITRLSDDYTEVPVTWGFDDLVHARVMAAASGAAVRRIAVPKGAFDAFYRSDRVTADNDMLPAIVKRVAGTTRCARYLVVTRRAGREPSTYDTVLGVGVINRGEGFGRYTHVFIMIDIELYDGTTFEKRAVAGSAGSLMSRLTTGIGPPSRAGDVDNANFPTTPADAASNTVLRDMARSMLKFRLDQRLPVYFARE